jgi:hypothetical protein
MITGFDLLSDALFILRLTVSYVWVSSELLLEFSFRSCESGASGIAMTGADDAHGSVLVSMVVHSARAADMECLYVHHCSHSCHRDACYRVWPMPVFLAGFSSK